MKGPMLIIFHSKYTMRKILTLFFKKKLKLMREINLLKIISDN